MRYATQFAAAATSSFILVTFTEHAHEPILTAPACTNNIYNAGPTRNGRTVSYSRSAAAAGMTNFMHQTRDCHQTSVSVSELVGVLGTTVALVRRVRVVVVGALEDVADVDVSDDMLLTAFTRGAAAAAVLSSAAGLRSLRNLGRGGTAGFGPGLAGGLGFVGGGGARLASD